MNSTVKLNNRKTSPNEVGNIRAIDIGCRLKTALVTLALATVVMTSSVAKADGTFKPFDFSPFYASSPIPMSPQLVAANFSLVNPIINNGFSSGPTNLSGINTVNNLISQIAGTPFVPIQLPPGLANSTATSSKFCSQLNLAGQPCPMQNSFANMPAAASGSLNGLLGVFGMGLPF